VNITIKLQFSGEAGAVLSIKAIVSSAVRTGIMNWSSHPPRDEYGLVP
jgi:hypothetical protein